MTGLTAVVVRRRLWDHRMVMLWTAVALAVELVPDVPEAVRAASGLWLMIGGPLMLLYPATARCVSTKDSQLLIGIGLTVLTDIVMALVVNTVLPPMGLAHPLARTPLAIGAALTIAALAVGVTVPRRRPSPHPRRPGSLYRPGWHHRYPPGLPAVLGLGGATMVLSVAGPIRLNNGYGSTASILALISAAGLLFLLLVRRRRYSSAVIGTGLFLAASGLLLLTSLRGWYITGHDIQREYLVFNLSYEMQRWSIAAFRNAYNSCLSVTLLPAALARLTGISGTWIFKAVMPLLFALTPVLVYRSVRNVAPQIVALLSAIYFMAFPTFFTDMPFLARQEVAFLLLACAVTVLTERHRRMRDRRIVFTVLVLGVVLSHYSTSYLVAGILGIALLADLVWRNLGRLRRTPRSRGTAVPFVTAWMVLIASGAAFAWTGPLTHTGGQVRQTTVQAVGDLIGSQEPAGSSDTGYSLVGGVTVAPAQRLVQYSDDTLAATRSTRARGDYLPLQVVDQYPVISVDEPDMALTTGGRALRAAGVDVSWLNRAIRKFASDLLQLLLLIGLLTTRSFPRLAARFPRLASLWPFPMFARGGPFRRRRTGRRRTRPEFRPLRDQTALTVGAVGALVVLTLLPQLSVDYGVLRAFQQGMLFFAPFVAIGSLQILRWTGRPAALLSSALALALFLDLTGLVPRVLGGYPAQLNLANAGQYYDIYYGRPEERSAVVWLDSHGRGALPLQTDHFTAGRLDGRLPGLVLDDIFPTLLGTDNYIMLGPTTTRDGDTTVSFRGDLVTYRYPTALLDATKNKLYSSDGAEIYR